MNNRHSEGLLKLIGLSKQEAEDALKGIHDDQVQELFDEHMPIEQAPDTFQQRLVTFLSSDDFIVED